MRRSAFAILGAAVLCAATVGTASAADVPKYRLVPLGFLADTATPISQATAINARGQVTGYSVSPAVLPGPPPENTGEAFRWDAAGGLVPLGFLPPADWFLRDSVAAAINGRGQVVGDAMTPAGRRAFLWDPSAGMSGLGNPGYAIEESRATGVNDLGTVVGYFHDGMAIRPFIWTSGGGMRALKLPEGLPVGVTEGINASGQIAGTAYASRSAMDGTAFLRGPDGAFTLIPTLPGTGSCQVFALNGDGVVVGTCRSATAGDLGFIWSAAEGTRPLGAFPDGISALSMPFAVNDALQVVGVAYPATAPFLWEPPGVFTRLQDALEDGAGWTLVRADDINDAGSIVGTAVNPAGDYEAVLLEPVTSGRITLESRGDEDGWVRESAPGSGRGGALAAATGTLRAGDDAAGRQYRAILSFDTSGIPAGAQIVAATLQLRQAGLAGAGAFKTLGALRVDLCAPSFGAATLEKGDFQAAADRATAGAFGAIAHDGWRSASLDPAALPLINRAGATQFRLRFARRQDGDGRADFVSFVGGEALTDRPTLTVEYVLPTPASP
jgi:probable HAF family extracellular repeat protein